MDFSTPLSIRKNIMPIYDYKCKCGKIFEHLQSYQHDDLKVCPCDKKKKVKRMMGRANFRIITRGSLTDKKLYKELEID